MPSAHAAYRPHPEVEVLRSRRISLEEAIRGVADAVEGDNGVSSETVRTTGTSLISFQQIPRVLESLRGEWSEVPSESCPRCFTEVQGRLTVHMHPFFLGARLMQGMRSAAGMLLMRYSRVLRQVPLAFKRLKPANTHAAIVGESAWVHFLIEFTSIGFRPTVDENLVGLLGPVQTAVGINFQVLKLFNLFVTRASLPAGSWFDQQAGAWMVPDQKLCADERNPQFLKVTKQMEETSGDYIVNMKGVLAKARKEAKLEASRRASRATRVAVKVEATSEAASGSASKKPSSSTASTEKRKKKEASDDEAAAAQGSSPAQSARQESRADAALVEGARKLTKVKKEPREDAAERTETIPAAAPEGARKLKKEKKEPREDAAERAEQSREDPAEYGEVSRKVKRKLREDAAEQAEPPSKVKQEPREDAAVQAEPPRKARKTHREDAAAQAEPPRKAKKEPRGGAAEQTEVVRKVKKERERKAKKEP